MMNVNLLSKITDYVLLNVCSLHSSGLYSGKSGVSLALFEVSGLLKDNYLEERAFELLEESLLYNGDDLSFHKGYSGIRFALLYLVEHRFVDADINELFGKQEQQLQAFTGELLPVASIPDTPLSVCIDRLYLLRCNEERNREEIEWLESFLFSASEDELERKLLAIMGPKGVDISYGGGLSRWLLYTVYVESLKRGLDTSRFSRLFNPLPQWKR